MKRYLSLMLAIIIGAIFILGCTNSSKKEINPDFEIGTLDYSKLARTSLIHLQNFEFDKWGETLSDDVKIYFPNGDYDTRTVIEGKNNVTGWYTDWSKSSGISSLKFEQVVFIPVVAKNPLNYSNLTGQLVLVYCSARYLYTDHPEFGIRTNYSMHFNENNLIDHLYMYYDRTPIIEATYMNVLKTDDK